MENRDVEMSMDPPATSIGQNSGYIRQPEGTPGRNTGQNQAPMDQSEETPVTIKRKKPGKRKKNKTAMQNAQERQPAVSTGDTSMADYPTQAQGSEQEDMVMSTPPTIIRGSRTSGMTTFPTQAKAGNRHWNENTEQMVPEQDDV
jgi:hypothetical protein